jgi:hypothetical protein
MGSSLLESVNKGYDDAVTRLNLSNDMRILLSMRA